MRRIYVIGGTNVDIYAKSERELVIKDSNISKINFSFGGVGRNIVENLANLNTDVCFVTAIGADTFGKDILTNLHNNHVDVHHSLVVEGYNTSTYMAVLNKDDMYLGMCDTSVLDDNLKVEIIDKLALEITDEDFIIFETNLSKSVIEAICHKLKGTKVVDAISTNKVDKLKDVLDKLDVFKLNKYEAEKISGITINSQDDIKTIIKYLNEKGVKKVLISNGSKLYVGTSDKITKYEHFAFSDNPVNVTGAGDSLLASYSYALFEGYEENQTAAFGISAAVLTVNDINAVAKLDVEKINNNIDNLQLKVEEI